MEVTQPIQLAPPVKISRHGKHKNPNYHREYYQQNRGKLLTYSHDYYGVKKIVESLAKENSFENGVKKKSFTGTRNIAFSNSHKEAFFFKGGCVKTKERNRKRTRREILEESVDKKLIRLATKLTKESKCQPIKKGWTYPNFEEWLGKKKLLELYQQWSIRGGKRIGRKFLAFLDVDIEQAKFPNWLKGQLRKKTLLLLNRIKVCYVETKRGFHIPILSDELLSNEIVYHIDSWKQVKRVIGSIQSKGKFVIGFDSPDKVLVASKGKCFWQIKNQAKLKKALAKFFLLVGNQEKVKEKITKKRISTNIPTFPRKELSQHSPLEKFSIQAKILSKWKICLTDFWKVSYLNRQGKKGYFLLNSYQKPNILPNLEIGDARSIWLVQGNRHSFFGRMIT